MAASTAEAGTERLQTFLDDGLVVVPDALAPGALAELQRAFRTAQGPAEAAWRASGAPHAGGPASRYFDMTGTAEPDDFLRDPTWLRVLLENPLITSLAQGVCGDGFQLYEIDARTVPPLAAEDGAARGGYVRWHR